MPLTKTDLEMLAARGCQNLDCQDPHCGTEFYWHSRCHPSQPSRLRWAAGVLQISCAACGRRLSAVQSSGPPVGAVCHPSAPVWVNWSSKRGTLLLECARCRDTVCELEVVR